VGQSWQGMMKPSSSATLLLAALCGLHGADAWNTLAGQVRVARTTHLRVSAPPVATFAANPPEYSRLKDSLMEHAVNLQLQHFKMVQDRGLQLWLKSAWDTFYQRYQQSSGESWRFLKELQYSDREWYFVPMRSMQQGSAGNPYLKDRNKQGYHCEVEPSKIAQRLMEVRKQLASEWQDELNVLASGVDHEKLRDEQLLAGLATRVALREVLHDMSLLPSQAQLHEFLSNFMVQHSMCMEPSGDVERMLKTLADQPIRIRGNSLIDPPQLVAEVRSRRAEILADMARSLDSTEEENIFVQTSFLEDCFSI